MNLFVLAAGYLVVALPLATVVGRRLASTSKQEFGAHCLDASRAPASVPTAAGLPPSVVPLEASGVGTEAGMPRHRAVVQAGSVSPRRRA